MFNLLRLFKPERSDKNGQVLENDIRGSTDSDN